MNKIKEIPKHVGIILDGNGRWATRRGLSRLAGHEEGARAIKRAVISANKIGIKVLSVFAFSTENWNRPKEEVNGIFDILERFLDENSESFIKNGYKLMVMGDKAGLREDLRERLNQLIEKTKDNENLIFNVGLNYGGRAEIIRATNLILKDKKENITEEDFEQYLYSKDLPPLDFVIRTSGEKRISNFMLWQMAYSEFYFPKIFWPSFNERQFKKAIGVFQKRNRRFGKI